MPRQVLKGRIVDLILALRLNPDWQLSVPLPPAIYVSVV